jgi:hypothetical protein
MTYHLLNQIFQVCRLISFASQTLSWFSRNFSSSFQTFLLNF